MIIPNDRKLVIIGDSITDYERARPIGEGPHEGIGKSYVALVDAFLRVVYPESRIRMVNMGTSGDTVRDLKKRWSTDVLDLNPDWVAILVGANDVWRQFDSPLMKEDHVLIDEYRECYEQLIRFTKKSVEGLILMAPFYMELNAEEPMRKTMNSYSQVVRELSIKHNCVFVDLPAAFDAFFQYYSPQVIAWDRMHPNTIGHMIIARAFVNAIGFEWNGLDVAQEPAPHIKPSIIGG